MAKKLTSKFAKDLLGPIEQLVLNAVARLGEEAYGMSVLAAIRESIYPTISLGSIYTSLERMTWKGYLTARLGESDPTRGGRARKYYRLSPAGEEVLAAYERGVGTLKKYKLKPSWQHE